MKRRIGMTRSTAIGLGLAAATGVARAAVGGVLDTSFGSGGTVVTATGGANAVAIQVDNKIVVAGYGPDDFIGGSHFTVARYDTRGALDTSFSADGIVTTVVSATKLEYATAVAIQPDGKILVAGYNDTSDSNPGNFVLIRYDQNGVPDTAFDGDGIVVTPIPASGPNSRAEAMALQADGKIVVVGASGNGVWDIVLVRYNADGSLDTSFDTGGDGDGIVIAPGGGSFMNAVAVQPDGRIVVAGSSIGGASGSDVIVQRYTSGGVLDTTFSGDGIASFNVPDSVSGGAYALALQPDGHIVVAGTTGSAGTIDFLLLRFDTGGALDTTFDGDGVVVTDFPFTGGSDPVNRGRALVIQPDGRILIVGDTYANNVDPSARDLALARYNADGTPDNTFSLDGRATTSVSNGRDYGNAVALRASGRIVVGGSALTSSSNSLVAQYLANDADSNDVAESWDVTPDAFDFTDVDAVAASSLQLSNTITVSGLGTGIAVPVKVSGGEYSLNSGAWTAAPGYVVNGDTLRVRHTAAGTAGTMTGTTLTVGGLRAPNNNALATGCAYAETFTSITSGVGSPPPPGGITGPTAACNYTDPLPSPASHVIRRGSGGGGAAGWPALMLLGLLALRRRQSTAH